MKIGLDTSVVLRLITGEPEDLALAALRTVERLLAANHKVTVSDLVASETYFALQYHFGMPKSEALDVLATFFRQSHVEAAGAAAKILATPILSSTRPGFVDRMIHAEYARIADTMLTFERAARKLSKTRVLSRQSS